MTTDFIPKIVYTPSGGSPTTINFDYYPKGFNPEGESIKAIGKVSRSANGTEQTSFNYNEENISLTFTHVTETIKNLVKTFFLDHASRGEEFDYYLHKTEAGFNTYSLAKSSRSFKPVQTTPGNWSFKLKFRRKL